MGLYLHTWIKQRKIWKCMDRQFKLMFMIHRQMKNMVFVPPFHSHLLCCHSCFCQIASDPPSTSIPTYSFSLSRSSIPPLLRIYVKNGFPKSTTSNPVLLLWSWGRRRIWERIPIHVFAWKSKDWYLIFLHAVPSPHSQQAPITTRDGYILAHSLGAAAYVECSALTMEGIEDVFCEGLRTVLNASLAPKISKRDHCGLL